MLIVFKVARQRFHSFLNINGHICSKWQDCKRDSKTPPAQTHLAWGGGGNGVRIEGQTIHDHNERNLPKLKLFVKVYLLISRQFVVVVSLSN